MSELTRREMIMDALAVQMGKLLRQEDDWVATASWLSDRALDDGFDLQMRYDNPEIWAAAKTKADIGSSSCCVSPRVDLF